MANLMESRHDKNWETLSNEAKDLILFAEEDPELFKTSLSPLLDRLKHQKLRGEYDPNEAKAHFSKHADRAAKKCTKVHGEPGDVWHKRYKQSHRDEAAGHWEQFHRDHLEHIHEDEMIGGMGNIGSPEQKKRYYEMVKAIMDNAPLPFKSAFTGAYMPKVIDAISEMKQSLKEKMFLTEPEVTEIDDENDDVELNEVSKQLLGKYLKRNKKGIRLAPDGEAHICVGAPQEYNKE